MNVLKFILCIIVIGCFSLGMSAEVKSNKKIIGIYEKVLLLPEGIKMPAKLDTGADISSIHGENIGVFKKDGKKYVKFLFNWDKNGLDEQLKIEKPFVRYISVKRKGGLKSERRPVVKLEFCLDGEKYASEFSIAERDNFRYPLLLGREFLRKLFIIDPDGDFLTNIDKCDKYIKNDN
jgi:hypothetical protein